MNYWDVAIRFLLLAAGIVSAIVGISKLTALLLTASREVKILISLGAFFFLLAIGAIKPTGAELAGLGVFLAGFAVLYRALMMERS